MSNIRQVVYARSLGLMNSFIHNNVNFSLGCFL